MAAESEAKRRGADEAVFVDGDGIVLEGTVTNVWWRSGDVLHTPSLDLGILAGVTRATLIELAPACGYRVEEGAYPLEALLGADEAFTSSSVREVMPLVEIDGRPLGRGPAADELQQALRALAAKV
jgi:branched-subunit amino acid aminotransferase/4-amino-4-deoxychorismate lyase